MKNYSIVRIGNEYIVQADDKSVLKIASRRRAVKLISDAAGLLERQPELQAAEGAGEGASITRDPLEVP